MDQKDLHNDLFREILNETGTAVYVADLDTGELVFMNQAMRKISYHGDMDYQGRNCYEYIMNHQTKCECCQLFHAEEKQNTLGGMTANRNGRHYDVTENLIKWEGRNSRIAFVHDTPQRHDDLKKMEILFNEMPAGIAVILSRPGDEKVKFYNNGFFNILGTTREKWEAEESSLTEKIHPQDREKFWETAKIMENQDHAEVTLQMLNGSGRYSWIEMKLMVSYRTETYKVIYAVATNIDLLMDTLKKQEECRVRQEEHYLRLVQNLDSRTNQNLFYIHFNLTQDTVIEDKTEDSSVRKNYTTGSYREFLESGLFQSPYEKETLNFQEKFQKEALEEQIKQGETRIALGQRTRMQNGLPLWISVKANLIQNPISGDLEVVIYGADITRQRTRKYISDLMMDKSYDIVVSFDLQNDSARAIHLSENCGYSGDYDIHGLNHVIGTYMKENGIGIRQEFHDAVTFMGALLTNQNIEQGVQFSYTRVDKAGNPHVMKGTFYLQDARNQMLVYLARDVTADWEEHNHFISQYEQALQEATAAVNEKKALAKQVYQESKKPLFTILEAVNSLDYRLDGEENGNYLRQIREACTSLIEGLSDKSGVNLQEFGGKDLYLEPVSIMDCLMASINKIETLREQKKIGVVTDVDASAYDRVMMDRHRFETLFQNLIQSMIECSMPNSKIFCEIERTGESKTNLEQVIRFGCSAVMELTEFIHSTNFSIIQKMAGLMNAELSVKDQNFTEFTIHTDLVKAKPTTVEEEYQNALYLAGRRLLLVSESDQGRKLVAASLEQKGLLSEQADNYEQAMNMIKDKVTGYYDMVIYNSNQVTNDQVLELNRLSPAMGLKNIGQFQFDQVFKDIFHELEKNLE